MMTEGDNGAAPGGWGRTLRVVGSSVWNAPGKTVTSMHHPSHRTAWAGAAVALGAFLVFYALLYAFPNARLATLQQAQDLAEQQDRAFCEKYGMPFGTHAHISCIEDLMDIRANERQRTLDEFGMC